MPDDRHRLLHELHEGIERLASMIPREPEPPRVEVVETIVRHLTRLLDVPSGLRLVRGMSKTNMPIPEHALDTWAEFLGERVDTWALLIDPSSIDDLIEELETEGPGEIAGLDWSRARLVAATHTGRSLPETGRGWKDDPPDWSDLPSGLRRRAIDLFARRLDQVMETLHMGEDFVDWRVVGAFSHYVEEALPCILQDPLDQWRWALERIRPSFATDGLYCSTDAQEHVGTAFLALPLPDVRETRAEVLELLVGEIPSCLLDDWLYDRLHELEAEFNIEDARQLKPATLHRKLKRALEAPAASTRSG